MAAAERDYHVTDLIGNPRIVVDLVCPPLLFVVLVALRGLGTAALAALAFSGAVVAWRVLRGERFWLALAGAGGVVAGAGFAWWSGTAEGFFGPDVILSAAYAVAAVASIVGRRPLIAWASWLVYRWPRRWYWHPRVRPAYAEVTWVWAAFFAGRAGVQAVLYEQGAVGWLTAANLLTGLPVVVALLVFTYWYVPWRLERLGAPDVAEFRDPDAQAV